MAYSKDSVSIKFEGRVDILCLSFVRPGATRTTFDLLIFKMEERVMSSMVNLCSKFGLFVTFCCVSEMRYYVSGTQ